MLGMFSPTTQEEKQMIILNSDGKIEEVQARETALSRLVRLIGSLRNRIAGAD